MAGWDGAAVRNGNSLRGSDGKRLVAAAVLALAIDAAVLASLSLLLAGAARATASGGADSWVSVRLEDVAPAGTELEKISVPLGTELVASRSQERARAAEIAAFRRAESSSVPATATASAVGGPSAGTELDPAAAAAMEPGAAARTTSDPAADAGSSTGARIRNGGAGTELAVAPIVTREDILVRLDEAIKRRLNYPTRARERGIEGRVLLEILVDEAGSLRNCAVETSSGSAMLDTAARRLLADIFPLRASLASPFSALVAVEYRLR